MTLTGCVYDKYTPESCPETGKNKYYMSFALQSTGQMAPATKASLEDGFETRTIEEHLIGKVDIYFYDASGKYQTHRVATYNNTTPSNIDVTFEEQKMQDGVAVGGYAQFTVELDERPYKILLLVNQPYDLVDKPLSEAKIVKQEKETSYKSGVSVTVTYTPQGGTETTTSVDPFFMSSVSYASAYGAPVCEQDVSSFYLQATKDDAKAHPMSVYVERMAAKVTVKANGQTESDPGQTAYTIPVVTPQNNLTGKVTIQKWGLNALNRYSYRFKQINPAWNFSWNWNSHDKKRSYWGQDPNYSHTQNSSVSQTDVKRQGVLTEGINASKTLCAGRETPRRTLSFSRSIPVSMTAPDAIGYNASGTTEFRTDSNNRLCPSSNFFSTRAAKKAAPSNTRSTYGSRQSKEDKLKRAAIFGNSSANSAPSVRKYPRLSR